MNTQMPSKHKRMIYLLGLLSLFLLETTFSIAQSKVRKFGTHTIEQQSFSENIQFQQNKRQIEKHLATNKNSISLRPHPVVIPLTFHIVYNNEVERISEAQIWSQIEALNQNFTHQQITVQQLANEVGAFTQVRPEQIPIQFCLAKENQAIDYVSSYRKEWGLNDDIKSDNTGGSSPWDTQKYLNIWVTNLADTVSGFSTMPWSEKSVDGIVIDYEFFGTMGTAKAPYNGGATLTHLVGNYMGLADLWNSECKDDGVFDTPIHNSPNRGCPGKGHISLCQIEEANLEMHMNFMDNTDDACMYMFTYGQMQRMYLMLTKDGPRHKLIKNAAATICEPATINAAAVRSAPTDNQLSKTSLALQIIPNPADSKVTININSTYSNRLSLVVYNALGKVKTIRNIDQQTYLELNTQDWEAGTYFIHCKSEQEAKTYQLMITH